MRIKIIGENNCARATRHLLRFAGFAVTDYLPADAVIHGPAAGYAITIDLSPATDTPNAYLGPDFATQQVMSSMSEEADRMDRDASSSPFAENQITAEKSSFDEGTSAEKLLQSERAMICCAHAAAIHFDSVDSALETAVLRHVAQLASGPVIVDRPGGVVHSERELRIVAPITGDVRADEAAAVAIEFGVLRGLLDLVGPDLRAGARWNGAGKKLLRGDLDEDGGDGGGSEENSEKSFASPGKKSWWPFAVVILGAGLALWGGGRVDVAAASGGGAVGSVRGGLASRELVAGVMEGHRLKPMLLKPAPMDALSASGEMVAGVTEGHRLKPMLLVGAPEPEPQGQFATGQGFKITDGVNFFVVDPCKAQTKLYASINQTGNTQLVVGTAAKKNYVCSIHVVAAAATNVAVVEGTSTVCGTGTAGVSGFGGATAATGWNFAGNGGIALGNDDSSMGAEGTTGDNLCIFNSGSGQVSGGISYVVE